MRSYAALQSLCITVLAASLGCALEYGAPSATIEQSKGLNAFFGSVDKDGDGQIEPAEALSYIGANFDDKDIHEGKATAASHIYENLEGTDADATISKAEVEKHIGRLLKANRVAEWLKHSAQMPQYVQAFRENQITSLDFPMLASDGGHTLEHDLGVKSKLHQEQLIRALKRVILGIGTPPQPAQELRCEAVSCSEISLSWRAPEHLGHPPMHKYKLERTLRQGSPVSQWTTANPDLDDEDTTWQDTGLEVGEYMYRLTAWNVFGWSEYAFSQECSTSNASLPCPSKRCSGMSCHQKDSRSAEEGLDLDGSAKPLLPILLAVLAVASAVLLHLHRSPWRPVHPDQAPEKEVSPTQAESDGTVTLTTGRPSTAKPALNSNGADDSGAPDLQMSQGPSIASSLEANDLHPLEGSDTAVANETEQDTRVARQPKNAGERKGSRFLADADCFAPGEVDSLRALSWQKASTSGRDAGPVENSSLMAESHVMWLDDQGKETAAPQGLESVVAAEGGDRHKCAFPGCNRSLRVIVSPKAAMTSHYCSLCQNVFCHHHTKYSPHGMLGSCGLDSKCICHICFDELPRLTQERLDKTNKIHRSARREDGTKIRKVRSRSMLSDKFGSTSGGSSNSLPAMSKSGEEHWTKLRTAWRAVKLFQGAGTERRRRTSESLDQE